MKNKCIDHPDKDIEYFCQECKSAVCPKCIFLKHNGHKLTD
jgi:hypothetical protein